MDYDYVVSDVVNFESEDHWYFKMKERPFFSWESWECNFTLSQFFDMVDVLELKSFYGLF